MISRLAHFVSIVFVRKNTMAGRFLELACTPSVLAAQKHYFGRAHRITPSPGRDVLTDEEIQFIQSRDSFYIATVTESDWPYVQHRGGTPGFIHVLSQTELAFADYRGNRQLLSTGNLMSNDRVCLFLMDYRHRARLKILGRARVEDGRQHPGLVTRVAESQMRGIVERIFLIEVLAFDWNCSQFIPLRYSASDLDEATAPLKQRITELEAQLQKRK